MPASGGEGHEIAWRFVGEDGASRRLAPSPATNGGFLERTPVQIGPCPGDGWSLFVDDERLERGSSGWWEWTPGFYAGEVLAELVGGGGPATQFLLDVSPAPAKLGRELYEAMLRRV